MTRSCRPLCPPLEQGAAAGRQLFQPERFAKHVIGTVVQQSHHRICSASSSQHDDGAAQLIGQAQGGTLFKNFGADQKIRRLILTDLESFGGSAYCGCEVPVLTQALHQNSPQSGVRLHDKNA